MSQLLKYNLKKFTQILIANQLQVGAYFALMFRNLLIIIIFALNLAGLKNGNFPLFILFSAIFKASEF